MQISSGLFDHMVIQRNGRDVSDIAIAGVCASGGTVQVRVRTCGRTVRGLNWMKIGQAVGKKFTARLKGLAVGGPYDIDLRIVDRGGKAVDEVSVRDVLVGDVWILAGQSNMEGMGTLERYPKADKDIRAFYMNEEWGVAKHPLHQLDIAVDGVHAHLGGGIACLPAGDNCVGPGLAFARMMKKSTGVPQGLIPSAHGGTSMSQWDPALKKLPGRSLYGATIKRAKLNGGRVAGIGWSQGSSDAIIGWSQGSGGAIEVQTAKYTARMKSLVRAFRRDLGDSRLPIVASQMARHAPAELLRLGPWIDIKEQQRLLPQVIDRLVLVPTIDLELEDPIHLSGPAQQRFGRRLAQAMLSLTQRPRQDKPPIRLGAIKVKQQSVASSSLARIEITFKNVVGKLVSEGRPSGFGVSLDGRSVLPGIYKTQLQGNRVVLHTGIEHCGIDEYKLGYGMGLDPYCNITDQADRSLPAFGPIEFGGRQAMTPFVCDWRVSDVLDSAGKLHKLGLPDTTDKKLGWRSQKFLSKLAARHPEWIVFSPEDKLVFYACKFDCADKMPLAFWIGYDGPVKVWIDGKMVFHDPNGTNPADPDSERIDFKAGKGVHEVVVGLGSNGGQAWGVCLRIERPDIPSRLLRKGPDAYTMPRILG